MKICHLQMAAINSIGTDASVGITVSHTDKIGDGF